VAGGGLGAGRRALDCGVFAGGFDADAAPHSRGETDMASIWEAPLEIEQLVKRIKQEHHKRLTQASVWVLVSDAPGIRDNRIIATQSKKATKTEKLTTGHDFKIIVMAETWSNLTDAQREVAIDEALCRCGVKYIPQTVEVNGKKEVVKDDLGRTIYTDQIAYDKEGNPKWKIEPPDAGLYFDLLKRHGSDYSEEAENVRRVLSGEPVKRPVAAERADAVDLQIEVDANADSVAGVIGGR
jgi:hypothetical protein